MVVLDGCWWMVVGMVVEVLMYMMVVLHMHMVYLMLDYVVV